MPSRAATRARPGRRGVLVTSAVAVIVVLVAELVLRTLPALPPPIVWNDVEVDQKAETMERHRAAGERAPVVYVGSSIIDAAIDPELVASAYPRARRGYNAALEGADGTSIAGWTEEVVLPRLAPEVVVVGLSPRELNDNGRNQQEFADTFFASRGWRDASGRASLADRLSATAEERSALARSRSRLRDPATALRYWRSGERTSWQSPNDPGSGRLLRYDDSETYMPPDLDGADAVFGDFEAGGRISARLDRMIERLHRADVSVVLLEPAVVAEDLDPVIKESDRAAASAVVRRLGASRCVPIIDLRDHVTDRSAFADNVHVNARGRLAVSTELGDRLAELDAAGELTAGCVGSS